MQATSATMRRSIWAKGHRLILIAAHPSDHCIPSFLKKLNTGARYQSVGFSLKKRCQAQSEWGYQRIQSFCKRLDVFVASFISFKNVRRKGIWQIFLFNRGRSISFNVEQWQRMNINGKSLNFLFSFNIRSSWEVASPRRGPVVSIFSLCNALEDYWRRRMQLVCLCRKRLLSKILFAPQGLIPHHQERFQFCVRVFHVHLSVRIDIKKCSLSVRIQYWNWFHAENRL